jgi:protein ATS1
MPKLQIYAAGSNSHGQLGTGNRDDAHIWTACPLESDYDIQESQLDSLKIKIVAGANHTLMLVQIDDRKDVLVAGASYCRQLGKASQDCHFTFTPLSIQDLLYSLPGDDWTRLPVSARNLRVKDVAAAWETSHVLLESKRDPSVTCLMAMGANDHGELGGWVNPQHDGPHLVCLSSSVGIDSITAGPRHAVALDRLGKAAGWGSARHGQLERLNILSALRPKVASLAAFTGTQSYSSVALGHHHTCLVPEDQRFVHLVGNNKKGQLGSSGVKDSIATLSKPKLVKSTSVYATWSSSFLLQKSAKGSSLLSFGNNAHGQLGRQGPTTERRPVYFPEGAEIVQIATGSEHVLALLSVDGERKVYGWGWNEHGNLAQGEQLEDVMEPKEVWQELDEKQYIHSVHAGNGTSWIVVLQMD